MKRMADLNEITDGKFYGLNDMVRANCGDCVGCSHCCHVVGSSIVLDPYDIFRLTTGLSCSFDELLAKHIELNMVDGIILPNLRVDEVTGCTFLDDKGRCSIHALRPGFCRIFPLGRYYTEQSFCYILQIHECPKNRTKIKVKDWIDTPELKRNQEFINDWHYFLEALSTKLSDGCPMDTQRQVQHYLLHLFYRTPYQAEENFYDQFALRLAKARTLI